MAYNDKTISELDNKSSLTDNDLLVVSRSGTTGYITWTQNSAVDHGSVAGLADDDHTQYALLAGRSGGQTLKGGIDAGDDLTLHTTSNASKGTYFLTDLTANGVVQTTGGTGALSIVTAVNNAVLNTNGSGVPSWSTTIPNDTQDNITRTGALASGSIAAGFGAIDNGTSNITTGGILKVDVDGTDVNAAGSFTYGAGDDAAIYWDGDESYFHQATALTNSITYNTFKHVTSGTPANGIGVGLQFEVETAASNNEKVAAIIAEVTDTTATSEDAELNVNLMIAGAAHTTTATFDLNGLNLASGDGYSIAGTSVLNATTLGTGVVNSSLTSLGTVTTGTWSASTIAVDKGGTGQTSYTDGQLLIGNTTGNTLAKATLTGGTNLSVVNGSGTITLNVDDAFLSNAGDVGTGTYDFGGADDFEIPNSATPTVDTAGQIAIDTTITNHTGLITYHDGVEALYAIGIPTANLTATDGHAVTYNATNNEFEMSAVTVTGVKSVQVFTASGTWTKPAGITTVIVEVQAGGGGGGGVDATGAATAGGGAGGGYARELIDVTGTSSETVTVGAGGTAGSTAGGNGGAGGTSSFGAFCSATGGGAGIGSTSGNSAGSTGGAGSGGDFNLQGGDGSTGGNSINGGGMGGTSHLGGSTQKSQSDAAGATGKNYGGGGQGSQTSGGSGFAGGAGAAGIVIVWEYDS